jgi:hypothetical protein
MTREEYLAHYSDGHCRKCGAFVGKFGPTDDYGYALIHDTWHNIHRHIGESVS